MIPDFSPPRIQVSTPQTFGDVRDTVNKLNSWLQYATAYLQGQLLPTVNSTVATTPTPAAQAAEFDAIMTLQQLVANLQQRVTALENK